MEVAAVVPVKFKRRSVSAVRDWPKGCGPPAIPVGAIPTKPPPAEFDTIKLPKSEEVPMPCVTNGLPPAAAVGAAASSVQVEPLVLSRAPKQEPLELVGSAEAVKPGDLVVSNGSVTPQTEVKEEEKEDEKEEERGAIVLSENNVKLETPEPSKGYSDQPEPLDPLKTDETAGKSFSLGIYPPPKRRKISAIRDFPVGCGRNAPLISREESSVVVTSGSSKYRILDGEKEHVVNQQPMTEVEAPTEKTKIESKRDESKQIREDLQETSGETQSKSSSAPLKRKVLDGERKPVVKQPREAEGSTRVASIEKVQGEVRRNDGENEHVVNQQQATEVEALTEKTEIESKRDPSKKIREDLQETSSETQSKYASAPLKRKVLDGEKKPVVKQPWEVEGSTRVASIEKVQREVRRNDGKPIRERAQEISGDDRVKSALKRCLSENTVDERSEKKISAKSSFEKNFEGHEAKQTNRNLPVKEARESKPSPDARFQPGSKIVDKEGRTSVGKPVDKGLVKHQMDAKNLKRKLPEERENKGHNANDQTGRDWDLESHCEKMIVQALMSASNCPWRQGKKSGGFTSRSVTPKYEKKERKSLSNKLALRGAGASRLMNEMAAEDEEDSIQQDEENEKALTVYRPRDLSVNLTPLVPPKLNHKGGENDEIVNRNKVKRALRLFQVLCRRFLQGEEAKSKKDLGRIRVDLKASSVLKENNEWVNYGKPHLGHVPGVEVGDEFHYRVELSIVGLHRPFQGGIDYMKNYGTIVATSIVASGGYADDVDSSDVLTYSGSGGNPVGGDKLPGDQKLERGNLALKNSIDAQTPVRVIHGFKETKTGSTFTYDGLYVVESFWTEKGLNGFSVFKFQLRRMAGQPELALKEVKRSKKAKVREGLCIKDISEGKESIPICAVNVIDDDRPMAFKYTTKNIYPPWYTRTPPRGCDCTDGCLDSEKCACAVKNGGEIPYNYNGAIVQAKPLVYECGPSCKCPPSCHNKVSQYGIRIPLEIFKTKSRGWGVRSLHSIPSGSFICEYIGELLKDSDAEQRSNDEYLFDIGHNYEDKSLWEGLPSFIPGLQSSSACEAVEDVGYTIDAAEYGNVGRFINHSCSPNLYAQNVLYDHDDKRMPHIMFFAADNIPPLQELTYHYNYIVDQVRDSEGNIKRKNCYCGSPECTGRLY